MNKAHRVMEKEHWKTNFGNSRNLEIKKTFKIALMNHFCLIPT